MAVIGHLVRRLSPAGFVRRYHFAIVDLAVQPVRGQDDANQPN